MNERPDRPTSLIALFRRSARLMVDDLVQRLAVAGYDDLPAAYHPVFENLDRGGTRLTVLAERAGMTHQSMGELVRTLVSRGYVERGPDPTDARVRLVVLTHKGRRMTRVAIREIASIQDEWLRRLSAVETPGGLVGALQVAIAELDPGRPEHDRPERRPSATSLREPGPTSLDLREEL